ncbi:MAG: hypothetical protein RLZZ338_4693 [Cyanobacteriota bacterium]|jgi:hypothetical protein
MFLNRKVLQPKRLKISHGPEKGYRNALGCQEGKLFHGSRNAEISNQSGSIWVMQIALVRGTPGDEKLSVLGDRFWAGSLGGESAPPTSKNGILPSIIESAMNFSSILILSLNCDMNIKD